MISCNFLNSIGVLVFTIFPGENNLIEEQSEIVNLDPGLREGEAGVGLKKKKAFSREKKNIILAKIYIKLNFNKIKFFPKYFTNFGKKREVKWKNYKP